MVTVITFVAPSWSPMNHFWIKVQLSDTVRRSFLYCCIRPPSLMSRKVLLSCQKKLRCILLKMSWNVLSNLQSLMSFPCVFGFHGNPLSLLAFTMCQHVPTMYSWDPLLTTMFGSASPVGAVVPETQTGDSSKQVPGVSTSLFSAWRSGAWKQQKAQTNGRKGTERNIEKPQAKQNCLIAAKSLKKRKQNGQLKQKAVIRWCSRRWRSVCGSILLQHGSSWQR